MSSDSVRSQTVDPHIPVYRPRLPSAAAVRPYLETLDDTRIYSNHGPLERRFAARLSGVLGSPDLIVTTANTGTAALTGAILARAGRASGPRRLCLCPGYSFVATPAAIEQAGYQPHFVDIDAQTWQADPDTLMAHPALAEVGVVVAVAPYGRGVPQEPWCRFEAATGIPVVIDGAASLECLLDEPAHYLGAIPVVLSFHATKVFATGEGGGVVTTDADLLMRTLQALNFGFRGTRRSDVAGFNGKMSEYHAAVGLAELDGWSAKRAAYARTCGLYRDAAARHGLTEGLWLAPRIASCYVLYEAATPAEARAIGAALDEAAVEHRAWYGLGLHREPYFAAAPRDALPQAESVAARLIGLPTAFDLRTGDIDRILGAVARGRADAAGQERE